MSPEEIAEEIKDLEKKSFMIQMNDHMSQDDYDKVREINDQINELTKKLESNDE